MRAVVTGQIGVDKKPYLEGVRNLAGELGEEIDLFNVGGMMYSEAPDVRPGRILDLPISRLASLRQRQETALRRREFQVLVQAFHEIIVIRERSSDVR